MLRLRNMRLFLFGVVSLVLTDQSLAQPIDGWNYCPVYLSPMSPPPPVQAVIRSYKLAAIDRRGSDGPVQVGRTFADVTVEYSGAVVTERDANGPFEVGARLVSMRFEDLERFSPDALLQCGSVAPGFTFEPERFPHASRLGDPNLACVTDWPWIAGKPREIHAAQLDDPWGAPRLVRGRVALDGRATTAIALRPEPSSTTKTPLILERINRRIEEAVPIWNRPSYEAISVTLRIDGIESVTHDLNVPVRVGDKYLVATELSTETVSFQLMDSAQFRGFADSRCPRGRAQ